MEQSENEIRSESTETDDESTVSPFELIAFFVSAAKRHKRTGISIGAGISALGTIIALIIPAKYDSESRILVGQSAAVTAALSTPDRLPNVDPFGGSSELLMQKSNLRAIVNEAKLVEKRESTRPFVLRIKDNILRSLFGKPKLKDIENGLIGTLFNQMYVGHDSSILTIHATWSDPQSAQAIALAGQKKFFELRREQELGAINAAISLNEDELKHAGELIDQSLNEVLTLRSTRQSGKSAKSSPSNTTDADQTAKPTSTTKAPSLPRRQPAQLTNEISDSGAKSISVPPDKNLTAKLSEIRQRTAEIEGPWQRRLAELKFQMTDLRGTYGPEHPIVRQQEAKIREAMEPPPELSALRDNERNLLSAIESAQRDDAAKVTVAKGPVRPTFGGTKESISPTQTNNRIQTPSGTVVITEREEDPVLAPANARLSSAISAYGEATRRLANARVQLASALVALQNRYVVISEPELPRGPSKPNRLILVLAAFAAGALVGAIFGGIRDLISGRIHEPWQLRLAGADVLGEVALPQK
jgi:uncharacterized protein involved in exopolysaccharide biosynthesis